MGRLLFIIFSLVATQLLSFSEQELANRVQQLYNQYGNQRVVCPAVKIVETTEVVAAYLPGTNEILVEQQVLNICQQYEEQSDAAIAFILGHELSHALQQHNHGGDFSFFAYDSKESDKPKYILSQCEKEADLQGAFGACLHL